MNNLLNETQGSNPISLGLVDLFARSLHEKHAVRSVKVIYNLEKNNCLVDAKMSDETNLTEMSPNIMSEIDYTVKSLVEQCLIVYNRSFLTKIIFEANLNEAGIIGESIKLACVLKTNQPKLNASSWDIVREAVQSTEEAEKLEMSFKRKKLRNITFTFDFGSGQPEKVYKKTFSNSFKSNLQMIVYNICNYQGTHEPSIQLTIDLTNREKLVNQEVMVYISNKLRMKRKQFTVQDTKYIINQLNQAIKWVGELEINGLEITSHIDGNYLLAFTLSGTSPDKVTRIPINLVSCQKMADLLSTAVNTYLIPGVNRKWNSRLITQLRYKNNDWELTFTDCRLSYGLKAEVSVTNQSDSVAIPAANRAFDELKQIVRGKATLAAFDVSIRGQKTEEIEAQLLFNQLQLVDNIDKPKILHNFSLGGIFSKKAKVYLNFELDRAKNEYHWASERYLGWAKI